MPNENQGCLDLWCLEILLQAGKSQRSTPHLTLTSYSSVQEKQTLADTYWDQSPLASPYFRNRIVYHNISYDYYRAHVFLISDGYGISK